MLQDLTEAFEKASSLYANANGIARDPDWFLLKLAEESGEVLQVANRLTA
ncbi:NTP pyrophosphatase (non-canonical NTP hydrolase) [Rhizobium paknamense]|uniref:NTP pyrophosphatase (Non-canonical NTP hydrolase) n=1 Tax=Rhizobium paknamense TaxID=1206817 RepID=A0ABU0IA27_9HYPH|nr:NTP pyrophosphatase (non-canonical NTP hydrolase) [Rhizobium paknamense]